MNLWSFLSMLLLAASYMFGVVIFGAMFDRYMSKRVQEERSREEVIDQEIIMRRMTSWFWPILLIAVSFLGVAACFPISDKERKKMDESA